jgi:hypothetical protein
LKPLLDARRAHDRLLQSTPRDRIRTHAQIFREGPQPLAGAGHRLRKGFNSGVPEEVRQHRRETVRELVGAINPATGAKWRYEDVAEKLGISKGAVSRYARVTGVAPSLKGKR